ncbi:hypothetical protein HHI36_005499 [Cryptolaemus montrouzieri]|uniref:Mutator-like transposase domain-containing protein n=1 Tax=Cryptolaemus montrouzieri TaxID=559131 RepID=A0ABD2NUH9_9CUCU
MFFRSSVLHAAKYAFYIGDGDAKTFSNLSDAKPYGDFVVKKLDCVLHVGRRMFRHLKDVKKSLVEKRKLARAEAKKKEEQDKKEAEHEQKNQAKVKQPRKKRKLGDEPVPQKTTDLTGKIMK